MSPPAPEAQRPGHSGGRPALLGVVLAGGKSSRMGTDKAQLPYHHSGAEKASGAPGCSDVGCSDVGRSDVGRSYLEHAILRLAPLVARVAVSGRDQQALDRACRCSDVIGLPDEAAELGPAMGVATALRYAAAQGLSGVLVTPVDMPELRGEHLELLVRDWSPAAGLRCASFSAGVAQPLLAIYPLAALAGVQQVVRSPRRSLSQWLLGQAVELVVLPAAVSKNVNRPEDR